MKGQLTIVLLCVSLLVCYMASGSYVASWTKMTGNNPSYKCQIIDVAADAMGSIFTTGSCADSLTFDSFSVQSTDSFYSSAFVYKTTRTGTDQWASFYGNGHLDSGNSVATDAQGNSYYALVLGGNRNEYAQIGSHSVKAQGGPGDAVLVKLDANKNTIWVHQFASTSPEHPSQVVVDSYGNSYLIGTTDGSGDFMSNDLPSIGPNQGLSDAFIAKINNEGKRIWHMLLGGSSLDYGRLLHLDKAGDLIVGIKTLSDFTIGSYTNLGSGCVVGKMSASNGTVIWAKIFSVLYITSVDSDADGNIYVTGQFRGSISLGTYSLSTLTEDMFLMKLNNNGEVQWAKQLGSETRSDIGHSVRFDKKTSTLFWSGKFGGTITINGRQVVPVGTVNPVGTFNTLLAQVDPSNGFILWYTTVKGGEGFSSSLAIDETGAIVFAYNVYAKTTPLTIQLDSTILETYWTNTILITKLVPEATCFGVASNSSMACSSHGTCNSDNVCSCYPNYSGSNCEIPICFGLLATDAAVCNFLNGTCIAADTCNCTTLYIGAQCQISPPTPIPIPTPIPTPKPVIASPVPFASLVRPKPVQSLGAEVVSVALMLTMHSTSVWIVFAILLIL